MKNLTSIIAWIFLFLLPTQLGKHFFVNFSYVNGVRIDYLAPAIYLTDIVFAGLVLLRWQDIWTFLKKHYTQAVLLTVLAAFSISMSTYPALALYSAARLVQIVIVAVICTRLKLNNKLILSAFAAGAAIQVLLTLMQFAAKSAIQGPFYYLGERLLSIATPGVAKAYILGDHILRPYGSFSHPNSLGGFYVLVYAYVLTLRPESTATSWLKFIALMLSTMLILISFSKGAILTFALITVIHIFWHHRALLECKFCTFAKAFIAVCVLGLFLSSRGDLLSIEKRLFLFEQAGIILSGSPFFGTGFGHHLFAHATFPSPYPYFFLQPVHNIFVLFVMQAGILISGVLVWIVWKPALKLWRDHKKHLALPLLAVLLTGMVDHYWLTLNQNMLLLGVVGGIISEALSQKHGKQQ